MKVVRERELQVLTNTHKTTMKKLFYSCAIMALIVSCSSGDDMSTAGNKFADNVVLNVEDYEFENGTRTNLTNVGSTISFAWKNGEAIGVFPIAPTTNYQAKQTITTDADGLNAEFNGAGWALLKGNTYAAYSPFVKDMCEYTSVPVTMMGQKQIGNASLKHIGDAYDYMYAKAYVPSSGGVVTFDFEHVGAIAMLQLTMPEDASWKSATLTSENSVFVSSCTMNVSDGSLTSKIAVKSQTLELVSVSGKDITLYMAVLPCTTGELTLSVTSSTGEEYNTKLTGKTLVAGKAYRWIASPRGAGVNYGEAPVSAQAVDLGLPSGIKWSNMNVGATSVTDYGTYFAWGEVTGCQRNTDGSCKSAIMDSYSKDWNGKVNNNYISGLLKSKYVFSDYKWCEASSDYMIKYFKSTSNNIVIAKPSLEVDDDAAIVNWKGDWRMPTNTELEELQNNCYSVWVDSYNGSEIAGVVFYKAKSIDDIGKKGTSNTNMYSLNDVHVFFPAAGYRYNSSFKSVKFNAMYWTSNINTKFASYASNMNATSNFVTLSREMCCYGLPVRAVCK